MTMPHERTRALRVGWEFLMELQSSDNLTDEQRSTVDKILRHYPTGAEIKQWAKETWGAQMAPEDPTPEDNRDPAIPDSIERSTTTPEERTRALLAACECFRFGLLSADKLSDPQKRQIPFVLRHFPEPHEIGHWAKMEAWEGKKNPAFKQWLEPDKASGNQNDQ